MSSGTSVPSPGVSEGFTAASLTGCNLDLVPIPDPVTRPPPADRSAAPPRRGASRSSTSRRRPTRTSPSAPGPASRPGLVVATEHQTAGRGRLDRTWETPRGVALTFSLLVAPGDVPLARWPWLPLLTGLAVVDAVRRRGRRGGEPEVAQRRAGRRGQARRHPRRARRAPRPGAAAVVGVGLNVSADARRAPRRDRHVAGARRGRGRRPHDAAAGRCSPPSPPGTTRGRPPADEGLRAPYRAACSTLGRDVRADLPAVDTVTGTAVDVDDEGTAARRRRLAGARPRGGRRRPRPAAATDLPARRTAAVQARVRMPRWRSRPQAAQRGRARGGVHAHARQGAAGAGRLADRPRRRGGLRLVVPPRATPSRCCSPSSGRSPCSR